MGSLVDKRKSTSVEQLEARFDRYSTVISDTYEAYGAYVTLDQMSEADKALVSRLSEVMHQLTDSINAFHSRGVDLPPSGLPSTSTMKPPQSITTTAKDEPAPVGKVEPDVNVGIEARSDPVVIPAPLNGVSNARVRTDGPAAIVTVNEPVPVILSHSTVNPASSSATWPEVTLFYLRQHNHNQPDPAVEVVKFISIATQSTPVPSLLLQFNGAAPDPVKLRSPPDLIKSGGGVADAQPLADLVRGRAHFPRVKLR